MAFTFQQLIDRARIPLNDADKDRYPDSELLGYGIDAYLMLRRFRPDLFLGGWTLGSWSTYAVGTTFPNAPDEYLPAIADYVTARAEFKDDESVVVERAKAFYQLFEMGIKS